MPFSEKEVCHILALLRAGETLTHSTYGGRYATTYAWRDGELILDCFEEGATWVVELEGDKMHAAIADAPDDVFVRLLARKI
jgi:hypothetical protein